MNCNHDVFVSWAMDHFPHLEVTGNEVKVPDIWCENDLKNHCWINTQKGCFHAFKSGKTGNLVHFVQEVESCAPDEAIAILGGQNDLYQLEEQLDKFFKFQPKVKLKKELNELELPEGTYWIKDLEPNNFYRIKAEKYLIDRCIDPNQLMVCTLRGTSRINYKGRIVIPYYDRNKKLIYYNTRALDDWALRYLGVDKKENNVGKSDVLFVPHYPEKGSKVYLTEGEFDCLSLLNCNYHSASCGGKELSEKQIEILRDYYITLAFDGDEAGKNGFKIAMKLYQYGIKKIGFVRPPKDVKDWNKMLVTYGKNIVRAYIEKNEKVFSPRTIEEKEINGI